MRGLTSSALEVPTGSDYIGLVEQGDASVEARLALLLGHRDKVRRQLDELRFALAVIDYKIATYGGHCTG